MLKELPYAEKFSLIDPWGVFLVESIKRDLKIDHMRSNPQFVQKYFTKKVVDKLTVEELKVAYFADVGAGNEEAAEWISSRWMLKNAEIYHYFAEQLAAINPNFDQIECLEEKIGRELMKFSVEKFGSSMTYVFSVLNSVAFSEAIFSDLRNLALEELQLFAEEQSKKNVVGADAKEMDVSKLKDKFEKRFAGMQKKYSQDVEALKKQIKTLQRKVHELSQR